MTANEIPCANGILVYAGKTLPQTLTDPIRERWQTDEDDDTVDILLNRAAQAADAGAFLRPARVSVRDGVVYLDQFPFPSELVWEKLSPLAGQTVVGYTVTCGPALWKLAQTEMKEDFFAAAIWDDIMLAYLRMAGDTAHKRAAAFFPDTPHFVSLNPGSLPTWDIFGQKDLFALLGEGADKLGVELSPSMLMLPTKSGSGIHFAADAPYENCERCPRLDCPNRRAPFKDE